MSKSLGNVIEPRELAEKYGVDPVRYFLLREVPFGNDGDFSKRALVSRMNVELANDLGNLAQRSLSLIARNCGGGAAGPRGRSPRTTRPCSPPPRRCPICCASRIDRQAFGDALEEVWKVIRQRPTATSTGRRRGRCARPTRCGWRAVLRVLADVLRAVATVLQPFMPDEHGARCWTSSASPPTRAPWRRSITRSPSGTVNCRRRRACSRATSTKPRERPC